MGVNSESAESYSTAWTKVGIRYAGPILPQQTGVGIIHQHPPLILTLEKRKFEKNKEERGKTQWE